MDLAIYAPSLGLSLPDQPFGKDVANRGLYSALASYGHFESIGFCTADNPPLSYLYDSFSVTSNPADLSCFPLCQTEVAARSGTLLRGQPYLSELSWERGRCHSHNS